MNFKNLFRVLKSCLFAIYLLNCSCSSDASGTAVDNTVTTTGKLTPLLHSKVASGGLSPSMIVLSPNGQYVYILNQNQGNGTTIGMFSIAKDGQLDPLSPSIFRIPFLANPLGMEITPDGRQIYVSGNGDLSVIESNIIFELNVESNGQLNFLLPDHVVSEDRPGQLAITPDGSFLYAAASLSNGGILGYHITTDGVLLSLNPEQTETGSNNIAVISDHEGQNLYLTATQSLLRYSIAGNGSLTLQDSVPAGLNTALMVLTPDGRHLYATDVFGNKVFQYARNTLNGALSPLAIPSIATGTAPISLDVTPDGKNLYVANLNGASLSLFSIDNQSGILSPIVGESIIATGTRPTDVVVTKDGKFVYVSNKQDGTVSMYKVD